MGAKEEICGPMIQQAKHLNCTEQATTPTSKACRANNTPNIKSSQSKQQLQHKKNAAPGNKEFPVRRSGSLCEP